MKKILLIGLTYFLIASCENMDVNNNNASSEPIKIELTANEAAMTVDGQDFAMKFFSTIYENEEKENFLISPFSLSMALGVVRNGAGGETKQEMQDVLGMKDFSDEEVNAYYKKLKDVLITTDPTLTLAIANSIWYNKDLFTIKSDFSNLSKTWFDAPVTGLDYSQMNKAVQTVNQWCEDNTNGLIKDMLENLAAVEILNALYFKGDWSKHYDFDVTKTTKEDFTKEDGGKIKIDLMNKKSALLYYEDEYLSYTSVPYGNKAYSMYFVLPNENVSFGEMTVQLAASGYWAQCIQAGRSPVEVILSVPKFKIEYKNKGLKDMLSQMGMEITCSSEAEFPHIAVGANFFIDRVTQKTYIQVDEKGTEAAAVTEIGMDSAAAPGEETPPKVFRADRPFLFLIQENSTGTILFMGKVGNPVE
ncbi:MAG: serpin family protein [Tannerella sp.]|jgi:serpin B|nr:serpin family protein [Tannerella sp.]